MRRLALILCLPLLLALALLAYALVEARADPIVRRGTVILPDWPAGAPAVTVALLSDIHIGNTAMDARRLTRIVGQVNALHPDLVLLAGDFIAGGIQGSAATLAPQLERPLSALRAPLGVVAVPGNHDHATGVEAVIRSLQRAGVTVLANDATPRGPLAIAGLDDQWTNHARLPETLAAVERLKGAGVMLAHSPELGGPLTPRVRLVLAGHTHCGQVVLPILGAVALEGEKRHQCGLVRDTDRVTIVSAGLGTSLLPVRFGAPPDLWLIRLAGHR